MSYSYGVKKSALNTARVYPAVGKYFSEKELNEITLLIEREGLTVSRKIDQLYVTDDSGTYEINALIDYLSKLIPKKETKQGKKKEIRKAEIQSLRFDPDRLSHEKRVLSENQDLVVVITRSLGEMNNYNMTKLIEFVLGKEKRFHGMLNSTVEKRVIELGFYTMGQLNGEKAKIYKYKAIKAFILNALQDNFDVG
ncbi:hypothetical protein ACTFQF_00240 [Aliivibrio fischeri]|uniref:Uncharacterized protein n=1 Tax=Aliivibrio fischeri (strain MJ11) TaxID=388396 RepID=B5EW15_ALIFM|nr:hypothetical protein [Aliivibrio fischeri]ACH64632.1 hypothetical protein VFMJ11_B0072 [Aliivibrio fischeri MJ11]MUK37485.1 hypothetical protein [Aliivibrio fischeri]